VPGVGSLNLEKHPRNAGAAWVRPAGPFARLSEEQVSLFY